MSASTANSSIFDFPVHWSNSLSFSVGVGIFAAASITDALDGKIARARGLVTNFGKFLDPLAGKVLVITALLAFIELTKCRFQRFQ